jgi:UDP-3-O-[3-hydroxymyristoyl] N-acetylglucosamine deacetylase
MRLLPAPAGSGVTFRRTDLDNFEIEATGRNVAKVSYATSLMRKGVLISTTEHLLSALIGMGIDNVTVELDNLELPILDGSALPYVQAFREAGMKPQRRRREYLRILKPVEVRENDKFIAVYPDSGYSISYNIDFPRPIGKSGFEVDEFVRHKVLDLIGDLALAGHRIIGRVVAERAGHAMHTSLVSRLVRDRSAWELVTLAPAKRPAYPVTAPSLAAV